MLLIQVNTRVSGAWKCPLEEPRAPREAERQLCCSVGLGTHLQVKDELAGSVLPEEICCELLAG